MTTLTLEDASDSKDWAKMAGEIEKGWNEGLDNLKSVLEMGIDLRFVNRPMLGLDGFEHRPGDEGVRIGGEGPRADKAGGRSRAGDTGARPTGGRNAHCGERRAGGWRSCRDSGSGEADTRA